MNLIQINPYTRVNDKFITERNILSIPLIKDNITHEIIKNNNQNVTRFRADFYKHIAADIVNETVFHYPYPYISEKTLRPIAEKRIFIILAPAGSLKFLKSAEFETFHDIVDESYDDIVDPEIRLVHVAQSVEKFCDLDIDTIKDYYYNNKEKFEHNFNVLKKYRNKELQRIKEL